MLTAFDTKGEGKTRFCDRDISYCKKSKVHKFIKKKLMAVQLLHRITLSIFRCYLYLM